MQSLRRSPHHALLLLLFPLLLLSLISGPQPSSAKKPHNVKVLPVFRSLPKPLIYYRPGTPVRLSCSALPRTARVQLLYRPEGDTNFQNLTRPRQGQVKFAVKNADNLHGSDLHCRARSSLGQVLSRPIRLVKTVLNASSTERFTRSFNFYRGNVAQVVCRVPYSQPPAIVKFFKDGDPIGQLDNYKIVRIDARKVVMLIKNFKKRDVAIYSCAATNPHTMEHVSVNERVQLKIESPTVKIKARLHVEDPFRSKQKKVVLREGENTTLYCLPEGAPIPSVKWYRHASGKSLPDNARIDSAFGTLELTHVRLSDASVYMCSVEQNGHIILTSPVTVVVLPRLKIIAAPRNVRLKSLGLTAKFTCTVAGGCAAGRNCKPKEEVRPEWYHNGKYIDPRRPLQGDHIIIRDSTITINGVSKDQLGVYQCVARSKTEWDSASAALALAKDRIIDGEQRDRQIEQEKAEQRQRANSVLKQPRPSPFFPRQPTGEVRPPLRPRPRPRPRPNLMPWLLRSPRSRSQAGPAAPGAAFVVSDKSPDANVLPAPRVKLLYDNLALELTWRYEGSDKPLYYRVQFQRVKTLPRSWDVEQVFTIEDEVHENRYIVLRQLKAGFMFRFRVNAFLNGGRSETSDWSRVADFSHVIPSAPSINSVSALSSDALRVSWSYTHARDYPPLDSFVLLSRRLLDPAKGLYDRYSEVRVKAMQRTYVIRRLAPGADYQMVIYGLVMPRAGRPRMITRFSNEVSKGTETVPGPIPNPGDSASRTNSSDSTKLLFWILGGLAGFMLLVMTVLIAMCILRQRREKKRTRAALHAQVNGTSLDSYKDPAKLLHRRQHAQAQSQANSQFLLAHLGGQAGSGVPVSGTGTWSGSQHHQPNPYLRGSSASVQQLHQGPPGSGMNLNVVPETQSLMLDHYHQQQQQQQTGGGPVEMTTDLGGYGPAGMPGGGMYALHGPGNGTLGSKSHLGSHAHHSEHDMGDLGYPMHTGSVGPYRPLGSGYAPFMTSGLRPSHLDVRPPPSGDAESIYSYFSQQEMGVQHCGLSDVPGGPPMPYRPQLAEAGSQTTDRQQHRHHRRRRRKQPPGAVPPTGPGGPLPASLERAVAPSPPMMRDMAVNTDLSSDGTYDQPGPNGPMHPYPHSRPPQSPPAGLNGHHYLQEAAPGPPYQAVSPPARIASLGQPHGYAPQELGPGHADASTLTRRGTPTLFVDPPKMRDYSEYAIPETKA